MSITLAAVAPQRNPGDRWVPSVLAAVRVLDHVEEPDRVDRERCTARPDCPAQSALHDAGVLVAGRVSQGDVWCARIVAQSFIAEDASDRGPDPLTEHCERL